MAYWLVPVGVHILASDILFPVLNKVVVHRSPSLTASFWWQYLFAAAGTTAIAAGWRTLAFDYWTAAILGIGFINGLAAFCQWQANRISLSKTGLFNFGDDLIAMGLGFLLLGERQLLTAGLGSGIILGVSAAILLAVHDYRRSTGGEGTDGGGWRALALYGYIASFSIIWGVAVFATRAASVGGMPLLRFIAAWYVGSFLAASAIRMAEPFWRRALGWEDRGRITSRDALQSLFLAAVIVTGMMTTFWALSLAPLAVVVPFFLIAEMIGPTLIGLAGFGEHRGLDWTNTVLYALAIAGGILIALNFRG